MSDPAVEAPPVPVGTPPVAAPVDVLSEVKATMARYEHDIVGKVHLIWDEMKALVAKVEGL